MALLPGLVALAGGGLLLGSLGMPWYRVSAKLPIGSLHADVTAWQAFDYTDKVLLAAAIVAMVGGLGLCVTADRGEELRRTIARIVRLAGSGALGLAVYRVASGWDYVGSIHNVAGTGIDVTSSRAIGAYCAVGASLAILAAGVFRIRVAVRVNLNGHAAQVGQWPVTPDTVTRGQRVAGWYEDPHAPGRERWWDGQRWTWDTRDSAQV